MKKTRTSRMWAFMLAVVMIAAVIPMSVSALRTYDVYLYEVWEDEATIVGFSIYDTSDIIIPSEIEGYTVKHIAEGAFQNNKSITSVVIPDTVTSIEKASFKYCRNLKSVTLSNSMTAIPSEAFYGCTSLETVVIPEGITTIKPNAFQDCTSLKEINLSSSVVIIGDEAFAGCTSLEAASGFGNVAELGTNTFKGTAFKSENGLTYVDTCLIKVSTEMYDNVSLKDDTTLIGPYAFYACEKIKSVNIPDTVKYICYSAFQNCTKLESIELPSQIISIPANAFTYCASLSSVNIPEGVTGIGAEAFSNCSALEEITLPESLETIDNGAFESTGLKSINIPDNVAYIGRNAFGLCDSMLLEDVDLPDDGVVLYSDSFYNSFYGGMPDYYDEDGAVYVDGYLLRLYSYEGDYAVKEGTVGIASNAFDYAGTNLTSVTINPDIKKINDNVFNSYISSFENVYYILFDGTGDHWENVEVGVNGNDLLENKFSFNVEGDVDRDGYFSASDALAMRKYLSKTLDYAAIDYRNADVNGDGKINAIDQFELRKMLAA